MSLASEHEATFFADMRLEDQKFAEERKRTNKQEPVPVILSLKGNETRAIPDTCTLAKYLVDSLRYNGKHPCDGCTENRMVCHGHAGKATSSERSS